MPSAWCLVVGGLQHMSRGVQTQHMLRLFCCGISKGMGMSCSVLGPCTILQVQTEATGSNCGLLCSSVVVYADVAAACTCICSERNSLWWTAALCEAVLICIVQLKGSNAQVAALGST